MFLKFLALSSKCCTSKPEHVLQTSQSPPAPGPRLLQLWVETSEAWEKARSLRGQKVPALGPQPHSCSSLSAPSEQTDAFGFSIAPSLPSPAAKGGGGAE